MIGGAIGMNGESADAGCRPVCIEIYTATRHTRQTAVIAWNDSISSEMDGVIHVRSVFISKLSKHKGNAQPRPAALLFAGNITYTVLPISDFVG
jgi:hypothetical protein